MASWIAASKWLFRFPGLTNKHWWTTSLTFCQDLFDGCCVVARGDDNAALLQASFGSPVKRLQVVCQRFQLLGLNLGVHKRKRHCLSYSCSYQWIPGINQIGFKSNMRHSEKQTPPKNDSQPQFMGSELRSWPFAHPLFTGNVAVFRSQHTFCYLKSLKFSPNQVQKF